MMSNSQSTPSLDTDGVMFNLVAAPERTRTPTRFAAANPGSFSVLTL